MAKRGELEVPTSLGELSAAEAEMMRLREKAVADLQGNIAGKSAAPQTQQTQTQQETTKRNKTKAPKTKDNNTQQDDSKKEAKAAPWDGLEDKAGVQSTLKFSAANHAKMKWVIDAAPNAPRSIQKIIDAALEDYLEKVIGAHWKPQ